jgi:hypothetical protein
MNGKKITNLAAPTNPTDAATKAYVDSVKTFSTGAIISGSDLNGRLTFSSPTGVNGIAWTAVDLSWVGRSGPNRLVMNSQADATGTDLVSFDETGLASIYGPINVGGAINSGGMINSNGGIVSVTGSTGNTHFFLYGPGNVERGLIFTDAAAPGPVFVRVNNVHTFSFGSDGTFTSPGGVTASSGTVHAAGNVTAGGAMYASGGAFNGTPTTVVLSPQTAGIVYLRPNGAGTATGEFKVDSAGNITVSGAVFGGTGYMPRTGVGGSYGSNPYNFWWTGAQLQAYVDSTNFGNILNTCDYRIKKDVVPLESKWDAVKALTPISYTHAEFITEGSETPLYAADDIQRWGFIAHEVQETLLPTAADGEKDAPNQIQNLNLVAVVAALTKALQEAMARIEALEAAA